MKRILLLLFFVWYASATPAQNNLNLAFYLPDSALDPAIPTPASFLGWEIGTWHVSHDQLLGYLQVLAGNSPRIQLEQIGLTHEGRPLIHLVVTSPENFDQLDAIRQKHLGGLQKSGSDSKPGADEFLIIYQGFSIHGNEASGSNAALLYAYYLAACKDSAFEQLLRQTVILLDPCFNPDGFNRFSSWVNSRRSFNLVTDRQSDEFHEPWPGGRTNHYWFDLNRDWLPAQQPESVARLKQYYRWHPHVLTDHHEMGSDRTFFFQPGVPSRTNPLTPSENQTLTARLGTFHAQALDRIGSLYYSGESYDDFYYGKGSSFPDATACIGVLFEQASARGHLQETTFGPLSLAFSIRNQLTTALSTLWGSDSLRQDLISYQQSFYPKALEASKKEIIEGYVCLLEDNYRAQSFLDILDLHEVEYHFLKKDFEQEKLKFPQNQSVFVPLRQKAYRLVKSMFDTPTSFRDSVFYDISAWTLPMAFGIPFQPLEKRTKMDLATAGVRALGAKGNGNFFSESQYAYLMDWRPFMAPAALNRMLEAGLKVRVASRSFTWQNQVLKAGTILIPVSNQALVPDALFRFLQEIQMDFGVEFSDCQTGFNPAGMDLGSPAFLPVKVPEILLLTGDGLSSYDVGEVWHLLDKRFQMRPVLMDNQRVKNASLTKYNTLILADGNPANLETSGIQKIRDWITSGGVMILTGKSINWAKNQNLINLETVKDTAAELGGQRSYLLQEPDAQSNRISGIILNASLDLEHPVCWGYDQPILQVFRSDTQYWKPVKNPYATPLRYSKNPLAAGYLKEKNRFKLAEGAGITVHKMGRGRIICMADNPCFRGFWLGTNKLLANGIFFGDLIEAATAQ